MGHPGLPIPGISIWFMSPLTTPHTHNQWSGGAPMPMSVLVRRHDHGTFLCHHPSPSGSPCHHQQRTKNADVALPPLTKTDCRRQQRHRLTPSPFATVDIDRGCCLPLLLTAGIALCHRRQRLSPSPFVTINKDCSCHPPMPSMETSSIALLTKTAVVALCRCFSRLLPPSSAIVKEDPPIKPLQSIAVAIHCDRVGGEYLTHKMDCVPTC